MDKIRKNGVDISNGKHGDVVEIIAYIRNEGRGSANGIDVRCYVNEILIDTKRIDNLQPGSLVNTICDTALSGNDQDNEIRIFVDSTYSIEESNEDNNEKRYYVGEGLVNLSGEDPDADYATIIECVAEDLAGVI